MGRPMESFAYGLIALAISFGIIWLVRNVKNECRRLIEKIKLNRHNTSRTLHRCD